MNIIISIAIFTALFFSFNELLAHENHLYIYKSDVTPIKDKLTYLIAKIDNDNLNKLPTMLSDLCSELPTLDSRLIVIFSDEKYSEDYWRNYILFGDDTSKNRWEEYQNNLIASYDPSTGKLTYFPELPNKKTIINIGNHWCHK